jgi:hypothetical protein
VVELAENIKHVGTYSVALVFGSDLTATVSVVVVAAGDVSESVEEIAETEQESE